jgi:hypothetical protein
MTTVFEPHWLLLDQEMVEELKPGDVLRRWKTGVWHLGVYLGRDRVLHNSPDFSDGECLTSYKTFALGRDVYVAHSNPGTRAAVMRRASGILAHPQAYSYVWRNCEHTVYEVVEGRARSPTVRLVDGVLFAAVLLSVAGIVFSLRKDIGAGAGKLMGRL